MWAQVANKMSSLGNCFLANDADEHLDWWFRTLEMYLPQVRFKGDEFPPRLKSVNDVVLIVSNHLSDLDHFLIMAKANRWQRAPVPVKITGFTQTRFSKYPIIGRLAERWVIGVERGSGPEEMRQQIQNFLDQGFNTFLLFPEGKIFCESSYKESVEWQRKNSPILPHLFHEVLYPRFGAYQALVNTLQDRLKYIIDITLDYPNHPLRNHSWDHYLYPSIFFSMCNKTPPVTMQVQSIRVSNWKDALERTTLLNLWRTKERVLCKKLRPTWQLGYDKSVICTTTAPPPPTTTKKQSSDCKEKKKKPTSTTCSTAAVTAAGPSTKNGCNK